MIAAQAISLQQAHRLLDEGRAPECVRMLERASDRYRDNAEFLKLQARALCQAGQRLPALRALDQLVRLDTADAQDWRLMGQALLDLKEFAQALGALERSVKMDRHDPLARHLLATACFKLGDVDRASRELAWAARKMTNIEVPISLAAIIPGAPSASLKTIQRIRIEAARRLADAHASPDAPLPTGGLSSVPRIGYLSSWFERPNYMKPVWGLINEHDRERVQIHIFSDCDRETPLTGYKRHPKDVVHVVKGDTNAQLGQRIRDAGIDVLVDLNAYSEPGRLPLFLQRHAPVTVAWFNMYATSGLPGFDYILGDAQTVLPKEERYYTERVARLPLSYLTFNVDHEVPPVVAPPCTANGFITFGSLIAQYKMTAPVMDAWAAILRKVPNSRLLLANATMKSPHNRDWLRQCFVRRGVDGDRILIEGPAEHYRYLQYYDRMDIALDAWPYNGGTTTTEAIWQGVPVLTTEGDRWASRTSRTLLRRSHLQDWVTRGPRAYVKKAVALAKNARTPEMLAGLRENMRDQLLSSSVCDTQGLARAIEDFFESALASTAR